MQQERTEAGAGVAVRVPAKVNLFLAVRGVQPDGYHELVTVMQTVSLYDRLRVGVVGPPGKGNHPAGRRRMRVELSQPPIPGLPPPRHNLAMRAAQALGRCIGADLTVLEGPPASGVGAAQDRRRGIRGRKGPRTVIDLAKGIPVSGGMAGGSADAAGALLALNKLWDCGLSLHELRSLGATLGSDVPFCVVGGTALARGRGTALAQVLCRGTFHWVVCEAEEPLSTAAVYSSWDRECDPSEAEPDATLQALRNADAHALGASLHNDLEPAAMALRPELREHKQALLDAGAIGAVLSGSGPTLLGLAPNAAEATALAARVRPLFRSVSVAHSPAGGPDLHG